MDLLGDIGAADQLTSTRAENKVLKERVQYLEGRCKVLTVENEALKAEVEIYRNEAASAAAPGIVSQAIADGSNVLNGSTTTNSVVQDDFVKGGDGTYARSQEVVLKNLHGSFNILCCSLSNNDSVLATGGADQFVSICQWSQGFGSQSSAAEIVEKVVGIDCNAPVIAIDFARKGHYTKYLAAGCMDGSVHVIYYDIVDGNEIQVSEVAKGTIKHNKYVRCLAWSPTDNILATGSADGSIQVHKLIWNFVDDMDVALAKIQTLQLPGPVESICFHNDNLCCYARGSPYLMYFDLQDNFTQQKINLNQGPGNAGFDEHVSFAVMDMKPHGNYLALATDISRNIVIDWKTGKQIRNLYGHQNDGFSQPKIAWSNNGQYLYGNSQEDPVICVWDIASSSIVDKIEGHTNSVRDMYSSKLTDTLVTTSFDKTTQICLAQAD